MLVSKWREASSKNQDKMPRKPEQQLLTPLKSEKKTKSGQFINNKDELVKGLRSSLNGEVMLALEPNLRH